MASPKNISLTNLFNLYTESPYVVVVKNISAKTSKDTLINYLAGSLNADVKELHYPDDVNSCCVAVFYRPIRDLGKVGRHLDQQPLDGHVLELCYLGECYGLLIRCPPSELCPTALDKFLRSEEFTGVNGEAVKDIEYISFSTGIFVVVQISDTAVTSRILNRPRQPECQNHDLDINPYFPNIHDVLRELGSKGIPCLGPDVCETDGTGENNRIPNEDHIKKDAAASIYMYQREGSTELETDGLSDVSTGTDGIKNGSSPKTEAVPVKVSLSDKEESIEDTECDFIKNESPFIGTVKAVTQESTCRQTSLHYDNIKMPTAQTESPSSEPNNSNNPSSSKSDDESQRKETADSDSQSEPIIGHSCQPPSEMPEMSAEKPLSESSRLAQKLQYGLSDKEAMLQALELSRLDDNNAKPTKEAYRRGSEDPCINDEKFQFGKDIQNQVCEQVRVAKAADGVVMRKPFKKVVREDLSRVTSSDDARKSRSEPDLRDQPPKEAGLSQFDSNRGKVQRHGTPSKGRKSASDLELRQRKLEQEAADEALAKSIADQEKQQLLYRRHQADQFRRERPHSAEVNHRDSETHQRPTSAFAQMEGTRPRSPVVQCAKRIKDACAEKISEIKQAAQRSINKTRTPAKQYTGEEPVKGTAIFRQDLEKHDTISDRARAKIRNILIKHDVKCNEIPGMNKFVLEGDKESVEGAYEEILQILFNGDNKYEAGPTSHKHVGARRDICENDDPKVPTYWENFNPGSSLTVVLQTLDQSAQQSMKKDHIRVELDSGDPVFKAIENIIQSTWDEQKVGHGKDAVGLDVLGYRKIRIKKIHRIENLQLYERYARHRNRTFLTIRREGRKRCYSVEKIPNSWGPVLTRDLIGCPVLRSEFFPELNEYFFFHGTSKDVIDAICNTGIDFRVGNQNAMYGAGIYGAECSTKADQYVDSPSQRGKKDRQMLLVRMILGDSYLCSDQNPYKYRRPPCANMKHLRDDCTNSSHGSFDSVMGQSRMFREFVVYEKDQCYPEYLITYNREK